MPTLGTLSCWAKLCALHAIVGDAGNQRRHHQESAGRQRTRKVYQPGLVDAELVHSVNDDNAGRESESAGQIDASGNWLAAKVESGVVNIDGAHFVVGDPSRGIRIGNALQQGSGLQIVLRDGIKQGHHDRKQQQKPGQ